ncbi:MAG TPA: hypothetical protein VJO72_08900, partial [Candidatus Dormibacteraeota bacterium]|nr:hypothetical protein [Candidatus Dormibacteraeota bacterium]
IDPWLQSGRVKIASLDSPLEEELYVQSAADLDDGEAMSLAICRARGYALATDDRKARRIASQLVSVTGRDLSLDILTLLSGWFLNIPSGLAC